MDDLLCGRLCLATMSLGMSKLAMAITVKYSIMRKSFGATSKTDTPILSYGSQLRSVATRMAQVYAMQAGLGKLACALIATYLLAYLLLACLL